MRKYRLIVNGQEYNIEAVEGMPLLWVLRDILNLTGTKYGCGIGQCGACTIHLDGLPIRSCLIPVNKVKTRTIETIENIAQDHPVKQAWAEQNVPQCGYCQSGQIMSAVALLNRKPCPNEGEIDRAMKGNICRCGTYPRIQKAIYSASSKTSHS